MIPNTNLTTDEEISWVDEKVMNSIDNVIKSTYRDDYVQACDSLQGHLLPATLNI